MSRSDLAIMLRNMFTLLQTMQCHPRADSADQDAISSHSTTPPKLSPSTPLYSSRIVYSTLLNLREESSKPCTYKRSFGGTPQLTTPESNAYLETKHRILKLLDHQKQQKHTAEKKTAASKGPSQTSKLKRRNVGDKEKETSLCKWLKQSLKIDHSKKSQLPTRRFSLNTVEVSN